MTNDPDHGNHNAEQTPETAALPEDRAAAHGPRYVVDVEGDLKEWSSSSITPAEIRTLAGWPGDQQIVLVDDKSGEETPLEEGVPAALKPGQGFGRKIKFKRGAP